MVRLKRLKYIKLEKLKSRCSKRSAGPPGSALAMARAGRGPAPDWEGRAGRTQGPSWRGSHAMRTKTYANQVLEPKWLRHATKTYANQDLCGPRLLRHAAFEQQARQTARDRSRLTPEKLDKAVDIGQHLEHARVNKRNVSDLPPVRTGHAPEIHARRHRR